MLGIITSGNERHSEGDKEEDILSSEPGFDASNIV